MWSSQQVQRYAGPHAAIPTSSALGGVQMGSAALMPRVPGAAAAAAAAAGAALPPEMQQPAYAPRRPTYCMQPSGPSLGNASPGAAPRLRYSAPSSSSPAHQQLQPQYPSHSMMQGGRAMMVGTPGAAYPPHMVPSTSTGISGMHGVPPGAATLGPLGQPSSSGLNIPPTQPVSGGGAAGASGAGAAVPFHPMFAQFQQPPPMQFPAGSVEATTISQRRRRKLLYKELIRVSGKRLVMALRSGLEAETTWALNALNVMLYDDSAPPTMLSNMPGLLNTLVDSETKARTADDMSSEFWPQASDKEDSAPVRSLVALRSAKNEP
ncbi:unnamed protein product, partial [Gongylonema pulchrum]|uniref:BAF250_C domain-containing protein n=1 Tax=Gongylonema pulchrum TaxID=637853 RepID=A0A183EJQ0_9BILA